MRSTSPRQKQDRPIESVRLKVKFRVGVRTARLIKQDFPAAVLRDGSCLVSVQGKDPGEVADRARSLLDKIRKIEQKPESL